MTWSLNFGEKMAAEARRRFLKAAKERGRDEIGYSPGADGQRRTVDR